MENPNGGFRLPAVFPCLDSGEETVEGVQVDIHEYFCKVFRYHKENPGQRIGQAYMNVLCKVRKDLADQVWMSDLDPFYDNSRLPNFIAWVGEHWE